MSLKVLLKGLATYVPGIYKLAPKRTGGTDTARYCYSVWLRHLIMAHQSGVLKRADVVAELGPGDSLGMGLAALISWAEKYYALDVVETAYRERNLSIFRELVGLFEARANIPDHNEFPRVKPKLDSYEFPSQLLTDDHLARMMRQERLDTIENAILNLDAGEGPQHVIAYFVPWNDPNVIEHGSVDMIFSQAVLEHVDDLVWTYDALRDWLKKDGWMSHQVDFKSHWVANTWDGHWTYSDVMWKLIKGKRPFLLNREPLSTHLSLIGDRGFDVVQCVKSHCQSQIRRNDLAARFKNISDEDMETEGAFILASKRGDG